MNVSELMRDLAEEVPEFDVTRAALRAARRHRTRTRLVAVSAVVAVLAVTATATVALRSGAHTARPGPAASGTDRLASAPRLPGALTAAAVAGTLPADGMAGTVASTEVGRAVLLYQAADGVRLLAGSGRQYRLGDALSACDGLSPDGRWLSDDDGHGGCGVRDLTGGRWMTGLGSPLAWSGNGRWLLTTAPSGVTSRDDGACELVELATGHRRTVRGPGGQARTLGVDGAGRPVFAWQVDGGWQVSVVDPVTGRAVQQTTLVLPAGSGSGQLALLTSAGTGALARVGVDQRVLGDVVTFDVATGAVSRRYPLAAQAPAGDARFDLVAGYAGTALLTRWSAGRYDSVWSLDLDSGTLRRVSVLPAGVTGVRLPGEAVSSP